MVSLQNIHKDMRWDSPIGMCYQEGFSQGQSPWIFQEKHLLAYKSKNSCEFAICKPRKLSMSLNDNSQPAPTQPVLPADPLKHHEKVVDRLVDKHEEMIHQQIEQIEQRNEDEK